MKNGLLLSVVIFGLLTSVNAQASKARMAALQGANHLIDTQTVLINPAHVNLVKNQLTFEMGAAGTAAEGGLVKSTLGSDKMMIYLGHQNPTALPASGDIRSSNSYLTQTNPVEVVWGKGMTGYAVSLSTVDNQQSGTKETTLIGKTGTVEGAKSYYAHLHLISSAEKTTGTAKEKIAVSPYLILGGSVVENYRWFGNLVYGKANISPAAGASTSISDTAIVAGVEDQSLKTALADIYYGAKLQIATRDIEGKKISSTDLPVFMGIEYGLTSWVTFRGSVSQNFLIGNVKDETVSTKADGISANTTVAAGLGFQHNNLQLDGTLTAASNGAINGNQFLANAGVTYNF